MLGGWCWEAVVVRTGVPDELEQLRGGIGERGGGEGGGPGHPREGTGGQPRVHEPLQPGGLRPDSLVPDQCIVIRVRNVMDLLQTE